MRSCFDRLPTRWMCFSPVPSGEGWIATLAIPFSPKESPEGPALPLLSLPENLADWCSVWRLSAREPSTIGECLTLLQIYLLTDIPSVPSKPPFLVSMQLISASLNFSILDTLLKMESNKQCICLRSGGLFSGFSHVAPFLSLLFCHWQLAVCCVDRTHFVYPFTNWWTFVCFHSMLLPTFGYKLSCGFASTSLGDIPSNGIAGFTLNFKFFNFILCI